MNITITYKATHRLKFANNYVYTKCGLCYNLKTGRLINQILKGGSVGYLINGNFLTLDKLRKELEVIPKKEYYPF